ncbi:MAG: tetratricopeptide repeat protein [Lewinellaceae bacterium]|nr:tetratricopeptide repeat protein [Lewinellaceae bacterium]
MKAKQAFLKAIETSKPLPSILTFLGALHSNAGQFAEAEPYYKMALEIEPKDVNCLRSLALVYFKTGRVEEASSHQTGNGIRFIRMGLLMMVETLHGCWLV